MCQYTCVTGNVKRIEAMFTMPKQYLDNVEMIILKLHYFLPTLSRIYVGYEQCTYTLYRK